MAAREPFPEGIDLVVYINLNKRRDRRAEIEREFARLEIPESKILRWPAVAMPKNPAMGCTLSHIAVMEHISTLSDSVQTVLVLEDDFNFEDDTAMVKESLGKMLQYPRHIWDVVLLSYLVRKREDFDDLISLTFFSDLASGYLINRRALPEILANFKEGCEKMEKTGRVEPYTLDLYWWRLMKNRRFFYFNRSLGYQRDSYSNIIAAPVGRRSGVSLLSDTQLRITCG